jgi:hypothetical protein
MSAKLVYIVSAGHSGSTLLDLVAGSIPGCFSTGELTKLPWQLFRKESAQPGASKQKLCSCGQGFHECRTWTTIIDALGAERGINVFDSPFDFKINLLHNKRPEQSPLALERGYRALFWLANRYACLAPVIPLYRKCLSRKTENNWLLFDTISNCLGAKFIVDSSKSIERFSFLHDRRPTDTFLILLKRDIRAVAFSEMKRGFDPVKKAEGWVRLYNRIHTILRNMPDLKYIHIQYEDLASDPVGERFRISRFIGVDDIEKTFQIDTRKTHIVSGNQVRHNGIIEIREDAAWRTGLPDDTLKKINRISDQLHPFWTQPSY